HCIVWMMLQHFNNRYRLAYAIFNHPWISLNVLVSGSVPALAFRLPSVSTKTRRSAPKTAANYWKGD
ncbi:MAG TPA: hypothetical protein VGU64_18880, partial [Terriglobales bacterium]|nr:hypothetical protein [Terriglobales bacterium]